jgi:uncharacterized protein (TIGR02452 family)
MVYLHIIQKMAFHLNCRKIHYKNTPPMSSSTSLDTSQATHQSFLSSAAPYAPSIGQPESGDLLLRRIHRVLAIAYVLGYHTLVLGAWGCGAFCNDPYRTAFDFRNALETDFKGHFSDVVFAITDWSPERRFLGPFRDIFSPSDQGDEQ